MSSIYTLKAVTKRYRKGKEIIPVLKDLHLEIADGDFLAVMGPSGSGKSTLLNLLSGIDRPSTGQVLFRDEDLGQFSDGKLAAWRARNIGFVFQFYHLIPMLTARQNVELPLLLTRLSGKERCQRVDHALDVVGMSDRKKHRPREMSGGQQQRVAIARAIVSDPTVIICDEPTGDLDRATADNVMGMIQLLNRELGKTVVMVTHDTAAAAYAGRMLHLDKGVLVDGDVAHA